MPPTRAPWAEPVEGEEEEEEMEELEEEADGLAQLGVGPSS